MALNKQFIFIVLAGIVTGLAISSAIAGGGGDKKVKRYNWCFSFTDPYGKRINPRMKVIASASLKRIKTLNWGHSDFRTKCFRTRFKTLEIDVHAQEYNNEYKTCINTIGNFVSHKKKITYEVSDQYPDGGKPQGKLKYKCYRR